jgi:decaprenylphospho-beta-D-erythro-pentofuranosid-2-ulose 2-reductase
VSTGPLRSALLLGGTSDIGTAIVDALLARGVDIVVLAGRDLNRLRLAARAFEQGSVSVTCLEFDATNPEQVATIVDDATREVGDLDVIIVSVGVLGGPLGEEPGLDAGPVAIAAVVTVNTTAAMGLVATGAATLKRQGHGTLIVLSSVAGFLVRSDNPIYGASKAALDGYAVAVGDLLRGTGAQLMVVRPGFVRTSMTAGMSDRPMTTTPAAVASAVISGMDRNASIVWAPRPVGFVMNVLRLLPAPVRRIVLARGAPASGTGGR